MNFPSLLAILLLWGSFPGVLSLQAEPAADPDDYKSQLDAPQSTPGKRDPNALRVLCIGDSITRHGTSEDTKKRLGWDHVAGMAATEESKDYAHLLTRLIQGTIPDRKVELYFHTSGGSGSAKQRLSTISEALPIAPHLVIIQLGEHEKEADGEAALRESYGALVTAFDQQNPRPIIIATGLWSLSKQEKGENGAFQYTGWAATVENAMKAICQKQGIPFVSVSELARDPGCRGWGEHPGVKWHPNDQGHAGYARKIFDAYLVAQKARATQ